MEDSIIYFLITASSYPFIALFNAGGAFYRAGGNSKFPMKISIISNVLNIIGNAVLIFGCNMGVAGAAISTLVSRAFCAIVVLYFLRKPKQKIVLNQYHTILPDFPLIGKVLAIGIPAGVENGMFQFGKLAIQSTVSTLGTQAIAAQAMTVIFENVNGIAAIAVGWTYDRGRSGVWRRKKRGSQILYYKINRICRDRADYFVCGHIPYQPSDHASCRHGG